MNLVKIADMLKNATDQALVQEVQQPSGSVPSYMVISELERRKKLRGSLMLNEPQTSVAEDTSAEFSGLGAMPQAEQYSETAQAPEAQGYAQGGKVVHARKGWFGEDVSDEDMSADAGYNASVEPGGLFRTDKMIKAPLTEEQQKTYLSLTKSGVSSENAMRMVRGESAVANQTPSGKPVYIPSDMGSAPAAAPAAAPAGSNVNRAGAAPARAGIPGAAAAPGVATNQAMQDLAEARKEGLAGIGSYNDYIQKAIDENKALKSENAWQALAMAGLGMMGGDSPYAAQNIGRGAMAGLQQFMGMEQSRQKEGRALAMDMAQAGLKRSEILSNLAKAGFEGQKAEAYVTEALGKGKYYTAAAGAQNAAASSGASGLKAENAQVSAINTEIKELQNRLKSDFTLKATERSAINNQIAALQQQRGKIKGYDSGIANVAPTGGSLVPGQNGRMVYTPGG